MNPFLLDQTFARLAPGLPAADRYRHVCGRGPDTTERSDDGWQELRRDGVRGSVVPAARGQRVALVCDAGLGKSTNVAWLASVLARTPDGNVPLHLRLDDANRRDRELIETEAARPGAILDRLAAELEHRTPNCRPDRAALDRLRADGRLTVLIDGLDHALSHPHFAVDLDRVLTSAHWHACPVWVAGRPHAFEAAWDPTFAAAGWEFVRVNPLATPEIRQYLAAVAGLDVYAELSHAHELLAVPRLLHLICGMVRRAIPPGADSATAVRPWPPWTCGPRRTCTRRLTSPRATTATARRTASCGRAWKGTRRASAWPSAIRSRPS